MNYIIIVLLLILTACSAEPKTPVSTRTDVYYITSFNRPKHFSISLRRDSDGAYFNNVHVSKHCNLWRRTVWVGKEITLTRFRYKTGGYESERFSEKEIYNCLCKQ